MNPALALVVSAVVAAAVAYGVDLGARYMKIPVPARLLAGFLLIVGVFLYVHGFLRDFELGW